MLRTILRPRKRESLPAEDPGGGWRGQSHARERSDGRGIPLGSPAVHGRSPTSSDGGGSGRASPKGVSGGGGSRRRKARDSPAPGDAGDGPGIPFGDPAVPETSPTSSGGGGFGRTCQPPGMGSRGRRKRGARRDSPPGTSPSRGRAQRSRRRRTRPDNHPLAKMVSSAAEELGGGV